MHIAGAVLAGGQSTRMGRTKALIEIDGRAMGDRVLDALRAAAATPLVLVGGDDDELAVLDAPCIPDLFPGEGPVGGVITALTYGSEHADAVFVLACDLPWISASALDAIRAAASARPDADAWVAGTRRLEPMCACWSTSPTTLSALRRQFDAGERALHRVIERLDHDVVDLGWAAADLRNVNAQDDLPDDADR